MEGFEESQNYESVVAFQNKYLAVVDEKAGVKIYEVIGQAGQEKLRKVKEITPHDFLGNLPEGKGQLSLSDISYYEPKNALLILDENLGVLSFKIIQNSSSSSELVVEPMIELIRREPCELMYLHGNDLFIVCDQIYSYHLQQWPRTSEKIYKNP